MPLDWVSQPQHCQHVVWTILYCGGCFVYVECLPASLAPAISSYWHVSLDGLTYYCRGCHRGPQVLKRTLVKTVKEVGGRGFCWVTIGVKRNEVPRKFT